MGRYDDLVRHGDTHRPRHRGGTDPIPGLEALGERMYPCSINVWDPLIDLPLGYDYGAGNWRTVQDAASPTGFFLQNDTSVSPGTWSATAEITFYMRLGPKGSLWCPVAGFVRDTDVGAFKLEIASIAEDTPGEYVDDPLDGLAIADPYYPASPTFYYPNSGGNVWVEDGATGSASTYGSQGFDRIRIMGDVGDPLTANPAADVDGPGGFNANGGPGLYALRLSATGADAGSSAKLQFWGLRMVRLTSNYYPFS